MISPESFFLFFSLFFFSDYFLFQFIGNMSEVVIFTFYDSTSLLNPERWNIDLAFFLSSQNGKTSTNLLCCLHLGLSAPFFSLAHHHSICILFSDPYQITLFNYLETPIDHAAS